MGLRHSLSLGKKIVSVTAHELGAHIKAVHLYPFGFVEGNSEGVPHPDHAANERPVVLVHGIVHNASAFLPLKKAMGSQGFKNVFSLNYSTRHGSLTKMVDKLSIRVDEILSLTGKKQIDIVGHSLGGLISRYYMSLGPGRGRVNHLVTLGTPHRGTPMSALLNAGFLGGLNTDLRAGSYFIRLLNETSLPENSRLTNIYATYDFVARPTQSCYVSGAPKQSFKNIELKDLGHLGLLYSERSLQTIIHSLLTKRA